MWKSDFIKLEIDYGQLPWYRKRWFVVLMFLLFAPVTIAIAATGDVYALRSGVVFKYGPNGKRSLIITACVFIILGLFKALGS